MRWNLWWASLIGVIAIWVFYPNALSAGQITPTAGVVVDPAECQVTPLSTEELRAIVERGIAIYQHEAEGTPIATAVSVAQEPGTPADASIIAAVEATTREITACTNAGDVPAIAALTMPDVIAPDLGRIAVVQWHVLTGGTGTPPPGSTPPPAAVDGFVAALGVPVPLPPDERIELVPVTDVVVLADGRVRAQAIDLSTGEPETEATYFRLVGDRYLVDVPEPVVDDAVSTPDAIPSP